jgi:hypothetical protein
VTLPIVDSAEFKEQAPRNKNGLEGKIIPEEGSEKVDSLDIVVDITELSGTE